MKKYLISVFFSIFTIAVLAQQSPIKLYPGLFEAVQNSAIFPDNKTFADAAPLHTATAIMAAYNAKKQNAGFNLKQFVLANFTLPTANASSFKSNVNTGIRKHIDTLWRVLQRKPDKVLTSTLIPLPYPYIVPGGRFREVYYWDSYFTMLGLQQSHQTQVIQNMINNFAYLIDHVGFIPNGNRTYYLTRSQPPFFSLMVALLAKQKGNHLYKQYQPQLLKEYNYWMSGSASLKPGQANRMTVTMSDGTLLNRYWDAGNEPREESYGKDVASAKLSKQQPAVFFNNVRSAAASGWDFSSRWFGTDKQLSSIKTIDIIPIDLNCLLYNLELTLARSYQLSNNKGQYNAFTQKAASRKAALLKYCWNEKGGWFNDYNWKLKAITNTPTLAAVFPLEFGIASSNQAQKIATGLQQKFLKPGGLVTTLNNTGQQWDAPNGWAPLQYMAIDGLSRYKHDVLAKQIAQRWVSLNIRVFKQTGKLLEKYNVEDINLIAGGGEYPLQDGFGWTNGVLLTLMNRYHLEN